MCVTLRSSLLDYDHRLTSSLPLLQVVYEVFSSFSQRFDEIREVQIAFLLEKWVRVSTLPRPSPYFPY